VPFLRSLGEDAALKEALQKASGRQRPNSVRRRLQSAQKFAHYQMQGDLAAWPQIASNDGSECASRENDYPGQGKVDADPQNEVVDEFDGRPVTQADRDRWVSAFCRLRDDGEIHESCLIHALQLCGHDQPRAADIRQVLKSITSCTTLSQDEFVRFVCLFEGHMEQGYREHFNKLGNGRTIDPALLPDFFKRLGLRFRHCALDEVCKEVISEGDNTGGFGLLSFQACQRAVELYMVREGFRTSELEQFHKAFRVFDRDLSGDIALEELSGALAWLGLPTSPDEAQLLFAQETDGVVGAALGEREFLRMLRHIHEIEMDRVCSIMSLHGSGHQVSGAALEELLQGLGYPVPPRAVLEAMQDMHCGGESVPAVIKTDNQLRRGVPSLSFRGMSFKLEAWQVCDLLSIIRSREGYTRGEWQELKEVFDRFCEPDSAELSVQGVGRALLWVGHPFSLDHLRDWMADIHAAGSDCMTLDFTLFVKLVRRCQDSKRSQTIEVFHCFEEKSSGTINRGDLAQALVSAGCVDGSGNPPAWMLHDSFAHDVHDFVHLVDRFRIESVEGMRCHACFGEAEVQKFGSLFSKFDIDGNGKIGRKELCRLIEHFFPAYAHSWDWRPQLVKLLQVADEDKDGSLDFHEFLVLMRSIMEQEDEGRLKLELSTIKELGFSPQEVRDLRNLFLKADSCNEGALDCNQIHSMLASCFSAGQAERCFHKLEGMLTSACREAEYKSNRLLCLNVQSPGAKMKVTFPVFLRVMRRVVDSGWMEPREPRVRRM